MKETTPAQKKAKELLYEPVYAGDTSVQLRSGASAFSEGYKDFLNGSKTEREAVDTSLQLLKAAGYQPFDSSKRYIPGDKIYFVQHGKSIVSATVGARPLEEGFRLVVSHIDSPRLDLRPNPLYEAAHLGYFKTHYYGGVRKYQWAVIPLALHGVFYRADGSSVSVCVGEDAGDPVFCITDLLPHLGSEQNERKLKEGIQAEELNLLIGSEAVEDEQVKERVKLNLMILLNEKYGITEKDFVRAEIEIVPACKAQDVGFDRSLLGGYGQDDRVNSYAALRAELETKIPAHTTVCILSDKEEIGSEGITGMKSMYAFFFLQQLCRCQGADEIQAIQNSLCLSADVSAAFDPTWSGAFAPLNSTYAGRGVAILKYTGKNGKSDTSDASAETMAWLTSLLDANSISWQVGELGRADLGGGGTIAKFMAAKGIEVVDIGVPVLSMHSPFEVVHKMDLYMAYRAFESFLTAESRKNV